MRVTPDRRPIRQVSGQPLLRISEISGFFVPVAAPCGPAGGADGL